MKIYGSNNRLILDVVVDDNSYRNRVIMGDHNLTLRYSLAEHVEIPVGAYCEYQNERYTLMRPEALKMKHSRYFEYTVTMESEQAKAKLFMFRNPVDGRLKFPLTARPKEHLQMFVDNMNRRDSGWSVGDCVDGTEVLITYDHVKCLEALGMMASQLNTEYEISGKRVSLRKVEYNKSNPLPLSYGRGNGFKPNVGRSNSSDEPPVETLFVQGGDTNIDRSKYGAGELLLPKNQTIGFDGEHFEDEDGYNEANARHYIVDDLGLSVRRLDGSVSTLAEDSLDCSDIYPKRVGTISEVVVVDGAKYFYDIIDKDIPDTLDYNDCQIEGETMTIIFQSGMLAGREFDVKYYHEASGTPNTKDYKQGRRFEIVPADIDGMTMPNSTFCPKADDTYAIFNCMLPDAYICDNDTKTGAEWDMLREAVRYLFDHEEQRFTFKGELDGIWAKKDWLNIGGRIVLGGFVKFTDERFQKDGVLVRITGIKDYINKPHSPVIELSNETVSAGFSSEVKQLESQEVLIEESHRDALNFTKRRWRDAKETISMLEAAMLENFTDSISPITVQTMQMLVGDESLQFRFVNGATDPVVAVPHNIVYDQESRQLKVPAGIIQHMTLGIASVSSAHDVNEYKFWSVPEYTSAVLEDGAKKYYLYAKVRKNAQTGEFVMSETAIKLEGVADYYHLLVGVLNSESEGERSFVTLYGFTEVLPGRITTERIVDGSGNSYFDMLNNAMKLGNVLDFNSKGDGQLRLKGTIVQSLGGDESPLGCYRGQWQSDVVYYNGDEVWYTTDGYTATYRYINSEPSKGHKPTESLYWQVVAAGKNGSSGSHIVSVFCVKEKGTTPATPTVKAYPPTGWAINPPTRNDGYVLWMSQCTIDGNGVFGNWSAPVRISGDKGDAGEDGTDIEFIYKRSNTVPTAADTPATSQKDDYVPSGWTDNPQGVSTAYKYEWMAMRTKEAGKWSAFSTPCVWSAYGDQGIDGDGFEYVFKLSATESAPALSEDSWTDAAGTVHKRTDTDFVPQGWTDDPTGVSKEMPYEYVATRKKTLGAWGNFSVPALWSRYAEDGTSVKICGTALGHYATLAAFTSAKSGLAAGLYLIDKDGDTYNRVAKLASDGSYVLTTAEIGDGYIMESDGHLWVATEEGWKDVGQIRGDDGKDGEQGNYTEFRYRVNGSTSQAPSLTKAALNPSGWVTAMPTVRALQYLWLTTAVKSGDGKTLVSQWTDPVRITPYDGQDGQNGADGEDGKDGQDGSDGRGITSVTEFYQVSSNRYTPPTSWQTTIPNMDSTNKYLWNKERVYYSKGTAYEDTDPVVIGVYGDTGVGITSVTEMYLASALASGVTKNTIGWSTSVQSVSRDKPYLYNYEIILYTNGTRAETDISLIGHWGADGADGKGINIKGKVDDWRPSRSGYIKIDGEVWAVDSPFGLYYWSESRGQYVSETPDVGDCYIVGDNSQNYAGHLIVSDGSKWTDAGLIVGADGDEFEFIFQRTLAEQAPTLAEGSGRENDDYVPSGWTDDPSGVSAEWPFEWFAMRKKEDGVWGYFSSPSLWATFASQSNPNLLEQTEFESNDNMNKWTTKSRHYNAAYADEVSSHIRTNGKDGFHSYFDATNRTRGEEAYKEVLQQPVWNTGGTIRKLLPSTWYTLSWWMRSGQNGITVNQTSNNYGFARYEVYLEAGKTYTFTCVGYLNAAARSAGHTGVAYIFNSGWTWSKALQFKNSYSESKTVTFSDVPATGTYIIQAYMGSYDEKNSGGNIGSSEMFTVTSYMLQCKSHGTLYTYCYPSAIDTSATQYVDGVAQSGKPTDGNHVWPLSPTGDTWVKHTFTFKTRATIPATDQYILFRLLPTVCDQAQAWVELCQIKLEEGMTATAYQPNSSDLHGNGYEFRYAKNTSATIAPSIDVTATSPSGWSTNQPTLNAGEYMWFTVAKKRTDGTLIGTWSTPVRMTPYDGKDGVSAAAVYRGVYSATKTYFGNSQRVDIVKYGTAYYVARTDAPNGTGGFTGFAPTNTQYWNQFGSSFESVATSLLLAELANIAGFIFRNSRLESQKLADGTTTDGATTKTPMVFLDGNNGIASFAGGKVQFLSDGSVTIGNGKFTIDKNGNVSMNDVTMSNITANSGTFKGIINAEKGLILKTQVSSSVSGTINAATVFFINKYTGQSGQDQNYRTHFNMPSNPNTGQMLTIKNANTYREICLYGNGHRIIPGADKEWDYPDYVTGGYYGLIDDGRSKQYIFDGSAWQVVGQYN